MGQSPTHRLRLQREIEKLRKRRADTEHERAQMEEEQALLARERAYAENLESTAKEEQARPALCPLAPGRLQHWHSHVPVPLLQQRPMHTSLGLCMPAGGPAGACMGSVQQAGSPVPSKAPPAAQQAQACAEQALPAEQQP